jgi:hypothetical protein
MSLDDDVSNVTLVAKASSYEVEVPRANVLISEFISAAINQGTFCRFHWHFHLLHVDLTPIRAALIRAPSQSHPTYFLTADASASRFEFDELDKTVLDQIVEYMNYHKGNEPPIIEIPLKSDVMSEVVSDQWDATFIDGVAGADNDLNKLYALVRGALLLHVQSLLHLGCAKIASYIKGKTIEDSRAILTAKKQ